MRLQYQAMSRKFISNPWTSVPHGHARTELNSLKNLIKQNSHECSIISESKDFGDILVTRSTHSFESRIFLRNPFYTLQRYWIIYFYFRETIEKFRQIAKPGDDLIFSSVNFEQFVVSSIFFSKEKLSLRVFNCPEKNLSLLKRKILRMFLHRSNCKIATETNEITKWFNANLDLKTDIVPPLNLLKHQKGTYSRANKHGEEFVIGLLYPVTSTVDQDELIDILDTFKGEIVRIKFPAGVSISNVEGNYEIIENGLSDDKFNSFLDTLDVVILMNHRYINRGSGLLTLCISLGKLIYVFKDNNFTDSYAHSYPLRIVENSKELKENFLNKGFSDIDMTELEARSLKFLNEVEVKWEGFLNVR